jgi:hypothetical protein
MHLCKFNIRGLSNLIVKIAKECGPAAEPLVIQLGDAVDSMCQAQPEAIWDTLSSGSDYWIGLLAPGEEELQWHEYVFEEWSSGRSMKQLQDHLKTIEKQLKGCEHDFDTVVTRTAYLSVSREVIATIIADKKRFAMEDARDRRKRYADKVAEDVRKQLAKLQEDKRKLYELQNRKRPTPPTREVMSKLRKVGRILPRVAPQHPESAEAYVQSVIDQIRRGVPLPTQEEQKHAGSETERDEDADEVPPLEDGEDVPPPPATPPPSPDTDLSRRLRFTSLRNP